MLDQKEGIVIAVLCCPYGHIWTHLDSHGEKQDAGSDRLFGLSPGLLFSHIKELQNSQENWKMRKLVFHMVLNQQTLEVVQSAA